MYDGDGHIIEDSAGTIAHMSSTYREIIRKKGIVFPPLDHLHTDRATETPPQRDGRPVVGPEGWLDFLEEPSQYIIKQIKEGRFFLGIETEELALPFAIKTVGNEPFIYSSDFPHEVTNESCKHDIGALRESGEITQDDKEAMLYRNAERFYKLPL
jgi:hypothetical protein